MTKQEFEEKYVGSDKCVAVHCDTLEKAKAFLKLAKSFGYIWESGNDLENISYWGDCKENTCYRFYDTFVLTASKKYYKENGYTIVTFELDEPNGYAIEDTPSPMKETFKIGDMVYNKENGERHLTILRKAWVVCYQNQTSYEHFVEERYLTHKKPLKKITKEQLADMGYEVEE